MEVDAAAEAAEALVVERLATSGLLAALREAQAQHGLRHGDYARYRRVLLSFARLRPADAKAAVASQQVLHQPAAPPPPCPRLPARLRQGPLPAAHAARGGGDGRAVRPGSARARP